MTWVRRVVGKRTATVGDSYRSVADLLLGITAVRSGYRVPDGLLQVKTNGATFVYADSSPSPTEAGADVIVGAAVEIGPDPVERAWDLAEMWVKNTTPASAATIVLLGPVLVAHGDDVEG